MLRGTAKHFVEPFAAFRETGAEGQILNDV